jgi:hypothetical protein
MLRRVLAAGVAVMLATVLSSPARADVTVTPVAKGYDIDVSDQASSAELLDAITTATGVTLRGLPDETTLSANHLRATSLERAIRMLMPGVNFTVRFGPDNAPAQIIFLSGSPAEDGTSNGGAAGTDDSTTPDLQDPSTDGGDTQGSGSDDDQSSQ